MLKSAPDSADITQRTPVGAAQREARTFFHERLRAISAGIMEAFGGTFFLLIAITQLEAGKTVQALIATGGSAGLLLGPLAVHLARLSRWPVNRFMAALHLLATAFLLLCGFHVTVATYTAAGLLALVVANMCIPLATQFYQQNYPDSRRGALFSVASTIRVGFTALSTWLLGQLLESQPQSYPAVILVTAAAYGFSALCFWRCPGEPLEELPSHRMPYSSLGYLARDKQFLWLIGVWMFMGWGNLMMVPLRIKYAVEPAYGLQLGSAETALVVGVVPAAVVFLTTWIWGRLFDAMNFFLLRAVLNTLFLISVVVYFNSNTLAGLVTGSAIFGLAMSGGNTAWSLWVTKIAPPEKVADYMSVHTFMTGVRGILAPSLAVATAAQLPISALVAISAALIGISTLMLGPELKSIRRRRPAQPLSNQIAE
jgi:hypothetical protein